MTRSKIISILGIALLSFTYPAGFLTEQKRFARVRTAIGEKQALIEKTLKENQISINNLNLLLIAYKENKELISFWDNLKVGYDKFVKDPKELNIKVADNGDYTY